MSSNYNSLLLKFPESNRGNRGTSSIGKLNSIIFSLCLTQISNCANANDNIITPSIASNFFYDSNFFRVSDDTNIVNDKSEFIKQIASGLKFDWKFNRQKLLIEASLNQNWFQNHKSLDYLGWNGSSQWNWRFGNNLDGEIGFSKKVFLGDYNQLNRFVANLQENQNLFANSSYSFNHKTLIKLGFFRKESQFDDVSRQISNSIEDNAELYIQYISPDKSTIGVHSVFTDGKFPNRTYDSASNTLDDGYKRLNTGLIWDWQFSSITHIDGMIGYLNQRYNHISERNFGDTIANLGIHWQATDKLLLDLLAKREIRQANNLNASFSLLQGIEFKTQFEIDSKVKLSIPMNYFNQQFLGDISGENSLLTPEQNNIYGLGLRLIYQPTNNINVNAILNFEKRNSNYATRAYQSQSAGLSVQAVF